MEATTVVRAGAGSIGAWFTQVGQLVVLTARTLVSAVRPPYPYGDELVWQFLFVLKLSWFPLVVTTFALCLGAPGLQSAGILSLLDALLETPMTEVIEQLRLPDDVRKALLDREGKLGHLLRVAESLERTDDAGVSSLLAEGDPCTTSELPALQIEALSWSNSLGKPQQG